MLCCPYLRLVRLHNVLECIPTPVGAAYVEHLNRQQNNSWMPRLDLSRTQAPHEMHPSLYGNHAHTPELYNMSKMLQNLVLCRY